MCYKFLLPIALLSGLLTEGRAVEYFVRPIVDSVNPHVMAGATATGWGLCTGIYWQSGPGDFEKEISLEFERARWSGTDSMGIVQASEGETIIPVLVNFRANFVPDKRLDFVHIYFGPCVGAMKATATSIVTVGGQTTYASSSDFDFAWGATAGLLIRITQKLDIDVGYRLLGTSDTKFQFNGEGFRTGKYTIDGWYAGIGWRF